MICCCDGNKGTEVLCGLSGTMEGLLVMAELFADVEFKSPRAEMPEHSNEGKLGDFVLLESYNGMLS